MSSILPLIPSHLYIDDARRNQVWCPYGPIEAGRRAGVNGEQVNADCGERKRYPYPTRIDKSNLRAAACNTRKIFHVGLSSHKEHEQGLPAF